VKATVVVRGVSAGGSTGGTGICAVSDAVAVYRRYLLEEDNSVGGE
jgi:hypothetical protein